MWHVDTDFVALLIFAVLILKNRHLAGDTNHHGRAFFLLLASGVFTTVVDILSSDAMNGLGGWAFYEGTMTLYSAIMPLPTISWIAFLLSLIYVDSWSEVTRRASLLAAPYLVYLGLALSNPWTGLFFTLSPDMAYARGPLFLSMGVGSYVLYSLLGFVILLANRKRIEPKSNITLMASFFFLSLASTTLQLANPGWLIVASANAIGCLLADATLVEQGRQRLYHTIEEQNEALAEAVEREQEATASKAEFFSRLSHDMRTPMNGILGMATLALEEDDPQTKQRDLENIISSGDYLLGLINDSLDIQRADTGNLKLEPELVKAADLIDNVLGMVAPSAAEKGVNLHVERDDDPDLTVFVDPLRIKQLFMNLLSNAIKYTPRGGDVTLRAEQLSREGSLCHCRVSVIDTGVGMSPEFVEKSLFEPFAQEQNEMSGLYAGSGLGLSIVKRLVDGMDGRIEVESELGRGSAFHVYLDLERMDASSVQTQAPATPTPAPARDEGGHGAKVLLCEDNALNAEIAMRLLVHQGYDVTVATNGKMGVDLFSASPVGGFAAILMDVRMPVMNGLEATRKIRALDREDAGSVPVIAMTADAFADDMHKTLEAGMNDHLAKPVEPKVMFSTLARWIGSTGTSRTRRDG
jgi:signal transduction histidine kinase/ActR/RegA family two-component response regulator